MNNNINESNKFNNFLLSVIPRDQYNFSKAVFALGRQQYFIDKDPNPAKQQLYTKMYNQATSSLSRMSIKQLVNNSPILAKQSYQAHQYMIKHRPIHKQHKNIAKSLNNRMNMYDHKVNNATTTNNPRVWDTQKINNYSHRKAYRYNKIIGNLYKKRNIWNNLAKHTDMDLQYGKNNLHKRAYEIESGDFAKNLYYKQNRNNYMKQHNNYNYGRNNYKSNYSYNNNNNIHNNRGYNNYRKMAYQYNRRNYNNNNNYYNNYYHNYRSNYHYNKPFSSRIKSQRNYIPPVKPRYNQQPYYSREQVMRYHRNRGIQR